MTLLLRAPKGTAPPAPVLRNKTGVSTLVKKAPAGRYDLDYWLAWLKANWS